MGFPYKSSVKRTYIARLCSTRAVMGTRAYPSERPSSFSEAGMANRL